MPNTSKPAYYNKAEIRFLIDQHLKGSPMNVGARDKRGHIRLAVATDLLAEIDARALAVPLASTQILQDSPLPKGLAGEVDEFPHP